MLEVMATNDDIDNDDGPYAADVAQAAMVLDNPDATERQQRSAQARVRRLQRRNPALGVSVFDFDAVKGVAYRLYYSSQTSRADPEGDAELAQKMSNPTAMTPADMPSLTRLVTRPYVLLKVNNSAETFRPDGTVAFHMKRPRRYTRTQEEIPFQQGDANLVLFEANTRRPARLLTIFGVDQSTTYDAASGTLFATVRSLNEPTRDQ